MAIELAIRLQSGDPMIAAALIMSVVLPLQISSTQPIFKPFIVKATIDAAVIMGMPASKAAKKYALQSQRLDFFLAETSQVPSPIGWRRLYFKKLFS